MPNDLKGRMKGLRLGNIPENCWAQEIGRVIKKDDDIKQSQRRNQYKIII